MVLRLSRWLVSFIMVVTVASVSGVGQEVSEAERKVIGDKIETALATLGQAARGPGTDYTSVQAGAYLTPPTSATPRRIFKSASVGPALSGSHAKGYVEVRLPPMRMAQGFKPLNFPGALGAMAVQQKDFSYMGTQRVARAVVIAQLYRESPPLTIEATYMLLGDKEIPSNTGIEESEAAQRSLADGAVLESVGWFQAVANAIGAALGAEVAQEKPEIQADRTKAPRGAAIRLTGRGFKPRTHVNILLDDAHLLRIEETTPSGVFPAHVWIWVPDSATFGKGKLVAEEGPSGRKTEPLDFEVTPLTREEIRNNLDLLLHRYFTDIPPNPRYANLTLGGPRRNISFAVNSLSAPVRSLWQSATSLLWNDPASRQSVWPSQDFSCSDYQARVMRFLQAIRFHDDPGRRKVMDGLEYGPLVSGAIDSSFWVHAFCVVWPSQAALGLDTSAQDYLKFGLALDPWPAQSPRVYEVQSGSAGWAASSTFSSRWTMDSHTYLGPRPENFGVYRNTTPLTGGHYYVNPGLADPLRADVVPGLDYSRGVGPDRALLVHCPVAVEVRDQQGRRAGLDANGEAAAEIPGSAILMIPDEARPGEGNWIFGLAPGNYTVGVTGTGEGKCQIISRAAGREAYGYPPIPVRKGSEIRLGLAEDGTPSPAQTEAGTVSPAIIATSNDALPSDRDGSRHEGNPRANVPADENREQSVEQPRSPGVPPPEQQPSMSEFERLAVEAAKIGDWAAAERHYRAGIAANDADPALHHGLGFTLVPMGRLNEALVALDRAARLAPRNSIYLGSVGELYNRLGQYDAAEVWLKSSLEADRMNSGSWGSLGTAYFQRRRNAEAEHAWREAARLDPRNGMHRANLAAALDAQGRGGDAILSATEALRLGFNQHWIFSQLGMPGQ